MIIVKLPHSQKQIQASLFTFSNLKSIVGSVSALDLEDFNPESEAYKEVQVQVNNMLKMVVMDKDINIDDLSFYDRDYLFMKILMSSDDLELNYIVPCDNILTPVLDPHNLKSDEETEEDLCNVELEHTAYVENIFLDKPNTLDDIELEIGDMKYLIKLKPCTPSESLSDLFNWVEEVQINGQKKAFSNTQELEDVLIIKAYNKVFKTVKEFNESYKILSIESEKKCHRCGKVNVVVEDYKDLAFFLNLYL